MPQSLYPWDAFVQHHVRTTARRRRGRFRFRLRTLFLLTTLACVTAFLVGVFWPQLARRALLRIEQTQAEWPTSLVTEAMAVPFFFAFLVVATLTGWLVNSLGAKNGFRLFVALLFLGLLAMIVALSLTTAPLSETELQNMTVAQALRVFMLLVGSGLPLGAFLGWYSAASASES